MPFSELSANAPGRLVPTSAWERFDVGGRPQTREARGLAFVPNPLPPSVERDTLVAALYDEFGLTCVPVAVNTGLFWPRRRFIRRPGTAIISFLPPIEPGLDRTTFLAELERRIETETAALVAEGQSRLS